MASPSDDLSDAPRSTRSRLVRWGGGLLGGLLVLVLAAALLLPRLFTSEELKGYVIPPMEEATGRTVEIDEIRLRVLWTPAVSVSGFRLADREGYGPEPAVSAGALNVEVALWPLLTGAIEPTAVELVDPTVRYEISEDGVANFDDLMATDTTAAEEENGALAVPVSDFRATGARLRYVDRSTGQALDLDFDARLRAILDGDALTSDGTIEVGALRAVLPDVQDDTLALADVQVTYDVDADLAAGRANLSELTVETAPLTLNASGTVARLATRPTLDLTVETPEADLARLAAVAPAASQQLSGLNPTGTVEATVAVQGPLPDSTGATDSLVVDGTGRLAGVGLDYQGRPLLRDLQADLSFSLEEAALRSVQGQLLGAPLAGNAAVTDPTGTPQVAMDVQTGAMPLADLAALAPPEQTKGMNPQGTLRLDATVEGPMPEGTDSIEALAIDGTGQLAGVGVDYDGAALLRDLGADLSFSGTSAAVQGIEGQLLGERLEGAVTIRDPMGDATVEGRLAGAADLSELSALAAEEGSNETSSIAGRADYDVQFSGPVDDPDAIRPTGEVRLADVQYPYASFRHPIEVPDATVQLTGTGLSMDRFTIRSGEQEMALAATARNLFPVSRGLAETDPAMALDFTFTADRLDLVALYPEATGDTSEVYYSQLFAATLSGSQVNGRSPEAVAKTLYGGTELPAYDVDGRVEIGTFLNDPQRIDDLAVDVQMRDRRLALRNLAGSTYDGTLAGSVTLDQSASATTSARRGPGGSVVMAAQDDGAAPGPPSPPVGSDLSYDIQLEGARAGAFLEDWTMLGRVVQGTLNLNIDGGTPLSEGFLPLADALTAEGTSIVADGGLSLDLGVTKALADRLGLGGSALTKFQRFGGPFTIEDGTLEMGTWTLGGATKAELTGALGLGGSVDVTLQMTLPVSALQGSKIPGLVGGDGALGGLVQKLAGSGAGDATIPVRVALGGTMREPTVEVVDKDAVRSALRRLVKEEGLGRLRNLLPGGGGG
jgi:uncharacterized protein involved in outer membrane biogenesis